MIFLLLIMGLGVKAALVPLHGWLPLVAEHGTIAVAGVFLLGLKTGVFALVRFVFPLLPDAVLRWHEWVVAFALAGIFYAATLALMQVNLRRLLAFAVISHTSVLVIGLFSLSQTALQGSILLSSSFGTATAGLLFMSGQRSSLVVIRWACRGVLEFVQDGVSGLIAAPDAAALAQQIDRLADPALAQRLGQDNPQRVAGISWPHVVRTLLASR